MPGPICCNIVGKKEIRVRIKTHRVRHLYTSKLESPDVIFRDTGAGGNLFPFFPNRDFQECYESNRIRAENYFFNENLGVNSANILLKNRLMLWNTFSVKIGAKMNEG